MAHQIRHLAVDEPGRVVRVDVRADLRDQAGQRPPRLDRRRLGREGAEAGDPDRAGVMAVCVAALDAAAAVAALEDVALPVDQVVVADVPPALGDRVVVVDRADAGGRVGLAVGGRRVVHDDLLGCLPLRRPDLPALGVEAKPLVAAPLAARDDRQADLLREAAGRRRRPGGRVDQVEPEVVERPLGLDLDVAAAGRHGHEVGVAPAVRCRPAVRLVSGHGQPVAPGGAVGADPEPQPGDRAGQRGADGVDRIRRRDRLGAGGRSGRASPAPAPRRRRLGAADRGRSADQRDRQTGQQGAPREPHRP